MSRAEEAAKTAWETYLAAKAALAAAEELVRVAGEALDQADRAAREARAEGGGE